ncbi:efflux RND transporter periplasmic adaptor subunit [Hymenobacter metallilatus]|uniref:Efflux RND transporter periplasmic adaptor subunit n=1 Tax=Hymenobacter metallilatus TaxID=2493666 RepID=A0A428JCZ2_9BACT|nr:efflux RND transporter periplasmic adaptor subunit [Hymenobacter metallilatus]RSK29898.1 efflux RND transporter periplasmic adaptor subunit [Hymenobacter metallilatus]
MTRLFHFASLLLLPSGLGLASCSEEAAETVTPAAAPRLTNLTTDTVRLAPVQTHLKLSGQVVTNADRTAPVYPVAGGVVESVPVTLGDEVSKGQVLAVVRSTRVAGLAQEAQVAAINLVTARRELAATELMHADGMASERELAQTRAAWRTAQAETHRVQQQQAVLGASQERYVVRAPLAGTITAKHVSAGMQFEPGQVDALFTLANLDEVWVLADVYQADIAGMRVGVPAEIRTLAYPDKVFTGQVDKVFNLLHATSKSLQVRVRLPNPGHLLKPSMYTQVQLTRTLPEQLPTVPAGSLVFANGRRYALVLQESGQVETRAVETGPTVGGVSFVRSGIIPGEQVVTGNPLLIYKELND